MFQPEQKRSIKWNNLNPRLVADLWEMHFSSDSWSARCRTFALEYLGKDIVFQRGSSILQPKGDFLFLYKSVWKNLVTYIYDCIHVLGVCPVTFRRSDPGDPESEMIPVIPARDTYVIQVAYAIELEKTIFRVLRPKALFFDFKRSTIDQEGIEHSRNRTQFMPTDIVSYTLMGANSTGLIDGLFDSDVPDGMVLDRNTVVLNGFGADPHFTGRLTTRMAALIEDRAFTDLHRRIMGTNQVRLMSRPLFLQENKTSNEVLEKLTAGFSGGVYRADGTEDRSGSNGGANSYTRSADEIAALAGVIAQFQGEDARSAAGASSCRIYDKPAEGYSAADVVSAEVSRPRPIATIPGDYTMPPGQKDDSVLGQRYFDLRSMLDDSISGAYGIPLPLLRQVGSLKGMEEQMMQHFHREVKTMSSAVSRVLTFCYHAIYGRTDENAWSMAEELEIDVSEFLNAQILADTKNKWIRSNGVMTRLKRKIESGEEHPRRECDETSVLLSATGAKCGQDSNADTSPARRRRKRRRDDSESESESDSDSDRPSDVDDDEELGHLDPEPDATAMRNSVAKKKDDKEKTTRDETDRHDIVQIEDAGSMMTATGKSGKSSSKRQRVSTPSAEYEPVEVNLRTSSVMMTNLLSYVYESGALTEDEFRTSMRAQYDFPINAAVLKKLKQEAAERDAPKATASSSASAAKKKKKDSSHPDTKKKGAGKGGNQTTSKAQDPRSMRKGNEKRSMQAQRMQTTNATTGRKANSTVTAKTKKATGGATQ